MKVWLIFVSIFIIGGFKLNLTAQAYTKDTVVRANIVQISKALSYYQVFYGKYPDSLEELVKEGDMTNIPVDYNYQTFNNNQSAIVFAKTENEKEFWCWNSNNNNVQLISVEVTCR